MEVLVLATNDNADALFNAVLRVLRSSATPIEILSAFPVSPEELQNHQVVASRQRLDMGRVHAIIGGMLTVETTSSADAASAEASHASLLRKIGRKSKKIKFLTEQMDSFKIQAEDAIQKAQHLELEQEQFFGDVQEMKAQYDKLAENHRKLMWEYLPARDPSLRAIPRMSTQTETPTAIGKYPLEQVMGYGQYAVVYSSSTPEHPRLAIKAIDKLKLVDLVSLHRISSEISSLSDPAIKHPGILDLLEVIHTNKHIYLITERGGKDLFEFFGSPVEGLAETTIRPLMLHLAQAVDVLHRNNYCHRDLKPENILYAPGDPHLVKLIDFGLCTKAVTEKDRVLHDFCGSPGFFAPEILLQDSYDGLKADVWSIGCVLLEMVLGNTLFSSIWMSLYELSILKEPTKFAESVKEALVRVHDVCHGDNWKYSVKLRSVLLGMLNENPSERLSIGQVLQHPWLAGETPSLPRSAGSLPSDTRTISPIKKKAMTGPHRVSLHLSSKTPEIKTSTSDADVSSGTPRLVSSAPHSPRSHHSTATKVSLPSLSPDKPASRRPPVRTSCKNSPEKLAFSITRA